MNIKRLLIALTCALPLFVAIPADAQTKPDYSNIDVSKLPEDQIRTQALKLKAAGFTLNDALEQAKLKGATSMQIIQLRQRLAKYLPQRSNVNDRRVVQANAASDLAFFGDNGAASQNSNLLLADDLAQRERITFTREDSLLFGFDIFNRQGLSFEPSTSMAVADSYIVGIGDQFEIDIYGAAEQSYSLAVARDGSLSIPMVGPVKVAGLKMADAQVAIMKKLRTIYSDMGGRTNASIRIAQVKPVKVSVIGEAFMPGTYTVSASSSLFNVLYLSGGPTRNGSYRDIQLIRGGRIVEHLDVYDFLINGKTDINVSLADGDIIMIPTYIKRVKTGGAFKRIGYFEAKEGETVSDLIRYAGGFAPNALTGHVGVFRIGSHTTEYLDVKDPAAITLASGDSLIVSSIDETRLDNAVTIEGAVFAPGTYEWSEGMKLSDLFTKAGGLKENAFLTRGVITRYKDDYTLEALNFNLLDIKNGVADLDLKSGDQVTIASIDELRDQRTVTVLGEVRTPGDYEYRENLTLGDIIILANGLTENAQLNNVEIVRRVDHDENYDINNPKETKTITITRDLAIEQGEGNSFELEPFDKVFIRTKATANIGGNVTIRGQVANPGIYGLANSFVRLSDIFARAGGALADADISAARIYRPIRLSEEEKSIRMRQSIARGDTIFYLGDVSSVEYDFVSIDLPSAIKAPGSATDIVLQNGDILEVPRAVQTVRLSGKVQSPTSLAWVKGWDAKDYIRKAGGFAPRAYKKLTYVVHANGESESVRHFLWFRRYPKIRPGSEVIVPERPQSKISPAGYVSMGSTIVSMAAVLVTLLK